MYLIDTNVISEARKGSRANAGVTDFFRTAIADDSRLYLSAITIGELRRGVELLRYRGDLAQARKLEQWLTQLSNAFREFILPFDADAAQVWGRLGVPHVEHDLDKQIAAIALVSSLTVVTRNVRHYAGTGVPSRNPFAD